PSAGRPGGAGECPAAARGRPPARGAGPPGQGAGGPGGTLRAAWQARGQQRRGRSQRAGRPPPPEPVRAAVAAAVTPLVPVVGTQMACRALGRPRSSWYRAHRRSPATPRPPRPAPRPQPRALSPAERAKVLDTLHHERFWDAAPASVYATLLDEGVYLASVATMYRLLRAAGETGDRRRHATQPARSSPSWWPAPPTSAVVGYHQTPRPGQMDLLLPVRDPGRLLALRGRVDGRRR